LLWWPLCSPPVWALRLDRHIRVLRQIGANLLAENQNVGYSGCMSFKGIEGTRKLGFGGRRGLEIICGLSSLTH